jgi:hypothetical protein
MQNGSAASVQHFFFLHLSWNNITKSGRRSCLTMQEAFAFFSFLQIEYNKRMKEYQPATKKRRTHAFLVAPL